MIEKLSQIIATLIILVLVLDFLSTAGKCTLTGHLRYLPY